MTEEEINNLELILDIIEGETNCTLILKDRELKGRFHHIISGQSFQFNQYDELTGVCQPANCIEVQLSDIAQIIPWQYGIPPKAV